MDQPRNADPDVVLQILTDPDSDLYPSAIGVYCDTCHIAEVGDFVVSDQDTQDERFEIARNHLRGKGWSCTEDGDFCPTCIAARTAAVQGA